MDKENVIIRNSRSNQVVVPSNVYPENILHHPMDTESYATLQGDMCSTDTPTALSNRASIKDWDRDIIDFPGSFFSHSEL